MAENIEKLGTIDKVASIPYNEFRTMEEKEKQNLVSRTFENFQKILRMNDYTEFAEISDLYKSLPTMNFIVRRENPEHVEELLSKGKSYYIKSSNETEYANCVQWSPSSQEHGIANAFLEGYGNKNSIVIVIGLRQTKDLELKVLPESTPDFYGLDRRGVRHVSGEVSPEQIEFVIVRAPASLLPESKLTESELDSLDAKKANSKLPPVFAYRGYQRKTQ